MAKLLTGQRVFYALLVLALIVALAPTSFAVKPDKTKDFNRCMEGCDLLKVTCDQGCVDECAFMFPDPNSVEFDECVGPCLNTCKNLMQNCRGACKFEKTGKTPNIPG